MAQDTKSTLHRETKQRQDPSTLGAVQLSVTREYQTDLLHCLCFQSMFKKQAWCLQRKTAQYYRLLLLLCAATLPLPGPFLNQSLQCLTGRIPLCCGWQITLNEDPLGVNELKTINEPWFCFWTWAKTLSLGLVPLWDPLRIWQME